MANLPAPIDYTTKDFDSFKASMLEYARRTFPEWSQASEGDFGVLMVELFAYAADILSYYGDRVANEAFLPTATQRRSVLNIADLLAYTPGGAIASTGTVTLANSGVASVVVPAGTKLSTEFINETDTPIFFETLTDLTIAASSTATVNVLQGETIVNEVLGTSDGTIDQLFLLSRKPVIDRTVTIQVGDAALGWADWYYVQHLIDAGPLDKYFSTWTDDDGTVSVLFGDGVDGTVPTAGASIRATYRIGGGDEGNIAAGKLTTIIDPLDGVSVATNVEGVAISSAMTGGADAESLDEIRENAPRSFRTQNRLVTFQDYKDGALGVAAVTKANAVANTFTSVTVYILGPGGTTNQALIDATYTYLNSPIRKTAGTTISVAAGLLVPINVTLNLGVLNQYDKIQVKNSVVQSIQNVLSFANQDFGARISVAAIYRAVAQVPGVNYAVLSNLARADAVQGVVSDIVLRDWEVPTVGTISIPITEGGF